GGVALRIDRDEEHLQIVALRAKQGFDLGRVDEGRRANVRALSEAEEHEDRLALEVGECPCIAVVILELESIPECGAGQVDAVNVLQCRLRFPASGQGDSKKRGTQGAQHGSALGEKALR